MLHEGRIDEALTLIESGRTNSPQDSDIIQAQRRIRTRWLSDKLIQVRLLRLAESKGESAELMRKVLRNEDDWAMMPTGAVYSTQAEEAAYLITAVTASIREALRNHHPLEAAAKYRRDRTLLEDWLKVETNGLKTAIAKESSDFCLREAKVIRKADYYSAAFLKKTCDEFHNQVALPKTENSIKLFRELEPQFKLKNMPDERVADFTRNLKTEFEKSLWYDRDSKWTLPLIINGAVFEKIEETKVMRSKKYMVSVPYEEQTRQKTRVRSGIEILLAIVLWAATGYSGPNETINGDGTTTVTETKYRMEERYYPYQATEVTQTLSVDWSIATTPQAKAHAFDFKDRIRTISDEHSNRFAEAGLQPETRKLLRPADWLTSLNRRLMDRLAEEFNVAWIEQFCSTPSENASTEIYHRCIYGANGHAPSFANEWFKEKYGIEIDAWRTLVAARQ